MSTRKRILFCSVPYHAGVVEVAGKWVPLNLVTLAGTARAAGHECAIYDAMTKGTGIAEICRRIEEFRPEVVAVSMITSTTPDGILVLEAAKAVNPAIVTVAGGIHASFMYEELFAACPALDYVVIGEGEETLAELLACLAENGDPLSVRGLAFRQEGGVRRTAVRPHLADLDNMPMAWDLLDWEDYTYFILPGSRLGAVATSRGCEQGCTFCSQQKFWGRTWRGRSAADVVREIEELAREHAVDVVLLTDDYPTPDRGRWEEMLDLLIARNLGVRLLMETRAADIIRDRDILAKYRAAGIIHIYVGTEATNQAQLDYVKKDLTVDEARESLRLCREHGIITETSMIIGFPDDTPESIDRTIGLASEFNPDFAHFLAITPWPYADITPELAPYIEEHDYRRYNLVDPVLKPRAMTRDQVDLAIIDGYRRFYMGKFQEILAEEEGFKKEYMLTAMRRIMSHSFIRKKLGDMGASMPEELRVLVAGGG